MVDREPPVDDLLQIVNHAVDVGVQALERVELLRDIGGEIADG